MTKAVNGNHDMNTRRVPVGRGGVAGRRGKMVVMAVHLTVGLRLTTGLSISDNENYDVSDKGGSCLRSSL